MKINRRDLITGLVSFVAVAPAIVRAGSIMPVKLMVPVSPANLTATEIRSRHELAATRLLLAWERGWIDAVLQGQVSRLEAILR